MRPMRPMGLMGETFSAPLTTLTPLTTLIFLRLDHFRSSHDQKKLSAHPIKQLQTAPPIKGAARLLSSTAGAPPIIVAPFPTLSFFDNATIYPYRFSICPTTFNPKKSQVFRFLLSVFRFYPYLCDITSKTEKLCRYYDLRCSRRLSTTSP